MQRIALRRLRWPLLASSISVVVLFALSLGTPGSASTADRCTRPSGTVGTSGTADRCTRPRPSATDPSGEPMPVGDLPGWKQIFTEDFDQPVPVGDFPGDTYGDKWTVYPDGWPDTTGNGTYFSSKVVSVADGVLTKHIHTEDGVHMVSAILPKLNGDGSEDGQSYGRYSVRFKSESIPMYKTAWLLWPDSEDAHADGEIDFPEGDLDSNINAFMHHADGSGDQDPFETDAVYTDWHTATIEWTPDKVEFILDGESIGTSTEAVPSNPMHWVLQTESCISCGEPDDDIEGDVSIDWVVAYTMD